MSSSETVERSRGQRDLYYFYVSSTRYHVFWGAAFKNPPKTPSKTTPESTSKVVQMAYVSRLGKEEMQDRVELCIGFSRKFLLVSIAGALGTSGVRSNCKEG